MKKYLLLALCGTLALSVQAQNTALPKPTAKPAPKPAVNQRFPSVTTVPKSATNAPKFTNSMDSASYALGWRIAQNLKAQGLDPINAALVQKALQDMLQGKQPLIPEVALDNCIGTYQEAMSNQKSAGNKQAGEAFLAKNGLRPGVVTLPSGLQYEVIKTGKDTLKPKLSDKVKVHYHGTLLSGEVFDSSVDRGEPIVYNLANFIQGWQEALQLMTIGSKWKLYVPSELGYGNRGSGKIAPGSTLVFEVELLGIE